VWIEANIDTILIVTGIATLSMLFQAIAPARALHQNYGFATQDRFVLDLARQNGILIAAIGALLLAAAFDPALRATAMLVAGATKVTFAGRILSRRAAWRGKPILIAAAFDLVTVGVFAWYLVSVA
jgi:hypothetical protein